MNSERIEKIKSVISIIAPYIFFFYFILLLIPNFFHDYFSNTSIGSSYRLVVFLLFALFLIATAFLFKIHLAKCFLVFLVPLSIYALSNVFVVIFINNSTINIGLFDRLKGLIQIGGNALMLFYAFLVFPKFINNKKTIIVISYAFVFFAIVASLYSWCFQFNIIINSLTKSGEQAWKYQVTSFFDNKNTYGLILFFALIWNIVVFYLNKHKWNILPIVFLFINLIISRAKTPLILFTLLLLIIFVLFMTKDFKKHLKRNIIILSIIAFVLLLFILFFSIPQIHNLPSLSSIYNYFYNSFYLNALTTFRARVDSWMEFGSLINNWHIFFGYGERIYLLFSETLKVVADNAYIDALMAGGIIKLLLLLSSYALIIFLNIKNRTQNKHLYIFSFSLIAIMLIYGMFENISVIGTTSIAYISMIIAIGIPQLINNSSSQVNP